MLAINELALARAGRMLFNRLSFQASPGQIVGVVGPNGCGKSSLFAALTGDLEPEHGHINIPGDWQVSQAKQQSPDGPMPAAEYVLRGHHAIAAAHAELAQAEHTDDGVAAARAHQQLEALDAYDAPARVGRLLAGLGFTHQQQTHAIESFSGGWRGRLALARALFRAPDVLLLDEPTNHLDLPTIDFLARVLKRYDGVTLVIAHDRWFLDEIADGVIWIDKPEPRYFAGGLTVAEATRAQQLEEQAAQFHKDQRRAKELTAFVDRFRAKASKAKQAQSRLKMLERLTTSAPLAEYAGYSLQFPAPKRVPEQLLQLRDADLAYSADAVIVKAANIQLWGGERVGLLGANGTGKSTLIKALANRLTCAGRIASPHLKIGYFAQHQIDQLDSKTSPLTHFLQLDGGISEQQARNFLGAFGIHGEMAVEPVAPRSGGEKARIALALLAWQRPNLLLLDEPTNHLDMQMRDALSLALQTFPGAVVTVSHDRAFVAGLCDHFYRIEHGNLHRVESIDGAIDRPDSTGEATNTAKATAHRAADAKTRRQQAAEQRKALKPLNDRVARCEKQMQRLEDENQTLQGKLADPDLYTAARASELQDLTWRAGKVQSELASIESDWLAATEALEAAQAEYVTD